MLCLDNQWGHFIDVNFLVSSSVVVSTNSNETNTGDESDHTNTGEGGVACLR
eukprot:m.27392 g.27392  ORF g.27392 m.27392 type:complete len:52 (-) comp15738_c0_seq2:677-832(-)